MPLSKIQDIGNQVVPNLGPRNVIINGAMNVAQRGTSATGLGGSDGYFTCDRWATFFNSSGRLTSTQDSSAPSGFAKSLKLDCTTADTSVASGEYFFLAQRIEGQNLQAFAKGTSDAKPFAVSFYVKGNASATYVAELFDSDNSRQISKTFTVGTDWARVELSFPADTTGAFNHDNNRSLDLNIWLHAGSDYTDGTLNSSAWASSTLANRAVGGSSFFDSTDRTFFITGVQIEPISVTEFEHEPFERTLSKCQRYFEKSNEMTTSPQGSNASGPYISISSDNSGNACWSIEYKVRKRADPTQTWYADNGTEGQWGYYKANTSLTYNTVNSHRQNEHATNSYMAVGGNNISVTVFGNWKADAEL